MLVEIDSNKDSFSVHVLDDETLKPKYDISDFIDEDELLDIFIQAVEEFIEDREIPRPMSDAERYDFELDR